MITYYGQFPARPIRSRTSQQKSLKLTNVPGRRLGPAERSRIDVGTYSRCEKSVLSPRLECTASTIHYAEGNGEGAGGGDNTVGNGNLNGEKPLHKAPCEDSY